LSSTALRALRKSAGTHRAGKRTAGKNRKNSYLRPDPGSRRGECNEQKG
jgi:hypothetical protein